MRGGHNVIDRTGEIYNNWIIVKYLHTELLDKNRRVYLCRCKCGHEVNRYVKDIVYGRSKSCGCLTKKNKDLSLKRTWENIKNRCYNPNNLKYKNYGARGIKVCDRWLNSYTKFELDMGVKPSEYHSIDRKDNDGDYEPDNCRWATSKEQSHNKQKKVSNYCIVRKITKSTPPNI